MKMLWRIVAIIVLLVGAIAGVLTLVAGLVEVIAADGDPLLRAAGFGRATFGTACLILLVVAHDFSERDS